MNTQSLLIVIVVALTLLLFVVGIQVLMIIWDIKKTLKKVNAILEDSMIGGGLLRPNKLTGILEMFGKKKHIHGHGEV